MFEIVCTTLGTAAAIGGFIYMILNNFRSNLEKRMDGFENKITSIEERMFWMATGKKLEDAILEEKMKKEAKNQGR